VQWHAEPALLFFPKSIFSMSSPRQDPPHYTAIDPYTYRALLIPVCMALFLLVLSIVIVLLQFSDSLSPQAQNILRSLIPYVALLLSVTVVASLVYLVWRRCYTRHKWRTQTQTRLAELEVAPPPYETVVEVRAMDDSAP
jgi:amino acid permease